MQAFAFIVVTYFLVTGGVVYDIINEPPSIGKYFGKYEHLLKDNFLDRRVNGIF